MNECVFCKIIGGQIRGVIVDEDESIVVFMSLEHHPLIVPKKHYTDLLALDDEIAAKILRKAVRVSKAMRLGLPCDGIYQTQTNGACADQSVFHYHMHLYPKWDHGKDSHQYIDRKLLAEQISAALSKVD